MQTKSTLESISKLVKSFVDNQRATAVAEVLAAAVRGDELRVEWALNHGFDVNAYNGSGRTALMMASINNQINTVRLIIRKGKTCTKPLDVNQCAPSPMLYPSSLPLDGWFSSCLTWLPYAAHGDVTLLDCDLVVSAISILTPALSPAL